MRATGVEWAARWPIRHCTVRRVSSRLVPSISDRLNHRSERIIASGTPIKLGDRPAGRPARHRRRTRTSRAEPEPQRARHNMTLSRAEQSNSGARTSTSGGTASQWSGRGPHTTRTQNDRVESRRVAEQCAGREGLKCLMAAAQAPTSRALAS